MRVAVTGADGFVGRHLVRYLASQGHWVVGTFLEEKPDLCECEWMKVDVARADQVRELAQYARADAVIHLAAISHVPDVASRPARAFEVNVTGLVHLLEALKGTEALVVVVSTGEVYGRVPASWLPISEDRPVAPVNLYGVTKACSEVVALYFHRVFGSKVTVVRPFSQMGPGQAPMFVCAALARQVARIALGMAEPVVKVGNLHVRRDFIDVRDAVRAYGMLIERYVGPGPFNICRGTSVSIEEILNTLIDLAGVPISVEVDMARVRTNDIQDLTGDCAAFSAATGWKPEIPLRVSLGDTLSHWKQQESLT